MCIPSTKQHNEHTLHIYFLWLSLEKGLYPSCWSIHPLLFLGGKVNWLSFTQYYCEQGVFFLCHLKCSNIFFWLLSLLLYCIKVHNTLQRPYFRFYNKFFVYFVYSFCRPSKHVIISSKVQGGLHWNFAWRKVPPRWRQDMIFRKNHSSRKNIHDKCTLCKKWIYIADWLHIPFWKVYLDVSSFDSEKLIYFC